MYKKLESVYNIKHDSEIEGEEYWKTYKTEQIKTIKSDDILEPDHESVFIKIDVEGHEDLVINGGMQYFSNCIDCSVFLENHTSFLKNKKAHPYHVINFLTEKGFTNKKIGEERKKDETHLEFFILEKK